MFILDQIRAIIIAVVLGCYLLIVCLIAIPFRLKRRLEFVSPHWKWAGNFALRHAARARIEISEDRRSPETKSHGDTGIFIANHQSFMDIPMLVTRMIVPPIMKKEVLYIPIMGFLAWICGAIPVSRTNKDSKRRVFELTKKRVLIDDIGVQVYPEGTRSKTAHPKPYEKIARALLVFAYKEKIAVVPASIYGTRGVLNSWGLVNAKRHLGMIIHEQIHPENFESADLFGRACWSKVIEGYEELAKKLDHLNKN